MVIIFLLPSSKNLQVFTIPSRRAEHYQAGMHFKSFYQWKNCKAQTGCTQNILKPKIENVTLFFLSTQAPCALGQPHRLPQLQQSHPTRLPGPTATPTGQGACLLEMHLASVVPQSRHSLCPKAAIWSSTFVSGSPLYSALSKVIWPSWTMLFPCCPWAFQCWLPLCPHVCPTDQRALLLFSLWVAQGCLVSSVGAAAGMPGLYLSLSSLMCVFTLKPQPKSCCPPFPALQFTQLFCKRRRWYQMQCKWIGSLWAIWFHSGAHQAWLAHHNTWKCLPFLQIVSLRRCAVMRIEFIIFLTNQYKNS